MACTGGFRGGQGSSTYSQRPREMGLQTGHWGNIPVKNGSGFPLLQEYQCHSYDTASTHRDMSHAPDHIILCCDGESLPTRLA